MLRQEGWSIGNADITIMCEQPKISPHSSQMRSNIASVLEVDLAAISVKATTTEKLGFCGRGEGIAASAIVLIQSW